MRSLSFSTHQPLILEVVRVPLPPPAPLSAKPLNISHTFCVSDSRQVGARRG